MTREEAIKLLRKLRDTIDRNNKYGEAEEMAIQALEQEPSVSEIPNNCEMRDATLEERESIDKYIKSISKPTGVKFGALDQEPCEDVISRDAALKPYNDLNDEDTISVWLVRENIKELPPVKPQTGHWIKMPLIEAGQTFSHKCSLCGRKILVTDVGLSEFPYCHCGARMESEQDG